MSDAMQLKKPLKVAVLCGWIGAERQVSLQSGRAVSDALTETGADVIECDIRPGAIDILNDSTIDLFFLALHGQFGEDGQIQAILSAKRLTYTGSGPEASRCAFDKRLSKNTFVTAGIKTPKSIEFDGKANCKNLQAELACIAEKFVVKPATQGSSVGVSIVVGAKAAAKAAKKCMKEFGNCIIEEFISGRELTVGIVDGKVLPIIEIKSKTDFYDYNAKYIDERTEFIFDSITDDGIKSKINTTAMKCFKALGCRDFARVDFILTDDGVLYAIELNTIPGFTTHSLLPMAAAHAGISMGQLCMSIVSAAFRNDPPRFRIAKPNIRLQCVSKFDNSKKNINLHLENINL